MLQVFFLIVQLSDTPLNFVVFMFPIHFWTFWWKPRDCDSRLQSCDALGLGLTLFRSLLANPLSFQRTWT